MKRKLLLFTIALLCAVAQGAWAQSTRSGIWTDYAKTPEWTEGDVWLIRTPEEFAGMAAMVNGGGNKGGSIHLNNTFKLMNDIDLSAHYWTPIGTNGNPFCGNFDGQNHTIKGMVCDFPEREGVGLFGYVSIGGDYRNHGSIRNVRSYLCIGL